LGAAVAGIEGAGAMSARRTINNEPTQIPPTQSTDAPSKIAVSKKVRFQIDSSIM